MEILAALLQKHARGEVVVRFCLAGTTWRDKKNDAAEDEKPGISIASAGAANSSLGRVQERLIPAIKQPLPFLPLSRSLAAPKASWSLSFWPRETAPAGAPEERMKR